MPVMPLNQESYVDELASNLVIAAMGPDDLFVHDRVAGVVPVQKQTGLYMSIVEDDFFRTSAAVVGPDAPAPEVGFHYNPNNRYDCWMRRIKTRISKETLVNASNVIDPVRDASRLLARQMKYRKELDFLGSYVRPGVWTGFAGIDGTVVQDFDVSNAQSVSNPRGYSKGQWNLPSSQPILDIQYLQDEAMARTSYKPKTLLLSKDVASCLKNHPSILERIQYSQKGIITWDLIAEVFEVDEIIVMEAVFNSAQEGQLKQMGFMSKNCALLLYKSPAPAINEPSSIYCFSWTGNPDANGLSGVVTTWFDNDRRSTVYEAAAGYDFKVTGSDFGIYLKNVLAY